MLKLSKPLTKEQVLVYHDEDYTKGDYYAEEEAVVGEWKGECAEKLGLSGGVRREDMELLLEGKNLKGRQLVRAGNHETKRAGWDMTFSAPKSVSLCAIVGGDERLLEAHRKAVDISLVECETYAGALAGADRHIQLTGNFCVASFEHNCSRALDPQLHTHNVVMNMTKRGHSFRGLESKQLMKIQVLGDAIYMQALSSEIKELGYDIERKGGAKFDIKGVTQEQIDFFSKRRKQILKEVSRHADDKPISKEFACLGTREKKQHVDKNELMERWEKESTELGLDFEKLKTLSEVEKKSENQKKAHLKEAVGFSADHNFQRQTVVREDYLKAKALQQMVGQEIVDLKALDREIKKQCVSTRREDLFTDPNLLAKELDTIAIMKEGLGRFDAIVGEQEKRDRLLDDFRSQEGHKLSPDQKNMVDFLLRSQDRVFAIQGKAGTGKTFALDAFERISSAHGNVVVRGFAPTTPAGRELAEKTNMKVKTVASFLLSSSEKVDKNVRHVWVVDEAGMIDTVKMQKFLRRAKEENARVILIGDEHQFKAIDAGKPYKYLQEHGMKPENLIDIRRQEDNKELLAIIKEEASEGNSKKALQRLDSEMGCVHEMPNRKERMREVVRSFMENHAESMIICPNNKERVALNTDIRGELRKENVLSGEDRAVSVLVSKSNLSNVEKTQALSYSVGDRIKFNRASKRFGFAKGATLEVVGCDERKNKLTVAFPNGKTVEYNPKTLTDTQVFRLESRLMAKGDRVIFTSPDKKRNIVNGELGEIIGIHDCHNAVKVKLIDSGKVVSLKLDKEHTIDHAYAVTTYKSQGQSVNRAINVMSVKDEDTVLTKELVYVGISRAKYECLVFTDDKELLFKEAEKAIDKKSAVEETKGVTIKKEKDVPVEVKKTRSVPKKEETRKKDRDWRIS